MDFLLCTINEAPHQYLYIYACLLFQFDCPPTPDFSSRVGAMLFMKRKKNAASWVESGHGQPTCLTFLCQLYMTLGALFIDYFCFCLAHIPICIPHSGLMS